MTSAPKRHLIAADLMSDAATQFTALCLVDLLVLKSDDALMNMLIMGVIHQGPSILLSAPAGRLVGRLGPRTWLLAVTVFRVLVAGAFLLAGKIQGILLAVYLLFILGNLGFTIGRLSAVAQLIPRAGILGFNALNERVALGAAILGPLVAGRLIQMGGYRTALALAMVFLLMSGLAVIRMPERGSEMQSSNSPETEPVHSCPAHNTGSGPWFAALGFVLAGGGVLNFGLPLFYKARFGANIADWGLIMAAFQAGAWSSTLILPWMARRLPPGLLLSLACGILALATAAILPVSRVVFFLPVMFAIGCTSTLCTVFIESNIQQHIPPSHAGLWMSRLTAFRGACYFVTLCASALAGRVLGADMLLLIGAGIFVGGVGMGIRN